MLTLAQRSTSIHSSSTTTWAFCVMPKPKAFKDLRRRYDPAALPPQTTCLPSRRNSRHDLHVHRGDIQPISDGVGFNSCLKQRTYSVLLVLGGKWRIRHAASASALPGGAQRFRAWGLKRGFISSLPPACLPKRSRSSRRWYLIPRSSDPRCRSRVPSGEPGPYWR